VGHTISDCKTNEVMRELRIPHIREFAEEYRRNWKEHIDRMTSDRIPERY
jgi:hypothetical protein